MTPWPVFVLLIGVTGIGALEFAGYSDQLLSIACLLALTTVVLMVKCGLWDCRTLYFAVSSIYVLAGPADVILVSEPSDLDPDATFAALQLGFLFLLASVLPMFGWGAQIVTRSASRGLPLSWNAAVVLGSLGAAAYLVEVAVGPGFAVGELTRAEVGLSQPWHFALIRFGMYALLLYLAMALGPGSARNSSNAPPTVVVLIAAFALFFAVELVVLGDRRMFVMFMAGAAVALFPNQTRVSHLFVAAAAVVTLLLYALVRNQPIEIWMELLADVDLDNFIAPRNLEFGAYALVASTLLTDFVPAEFPDYLQALPQLIPGFLFEGRPEAPSQWFVRTYFPDVAEIGGAFAFNFVVEAYLNGGILGVLVVGLGIGSLLGYASNGRFCAVLNPLAAVTFVFLMRLDLASMLRNVLITGAALFGIYLWFRIVRNARVTSVVGA